MKNETIAKILSAHDIPHYIRNGHIFADSMQSGTAEFEFVDDLTGITKTELFDYLGY